MLLLIADCSPRVRRHPSKLRATTGLAKSFSLDKCLEIYPEESYHKITNGSGKSLYYLDKGLKHKGSVVTEGFQFQKNNAQDFELVYSIRSLISEGCVTYQVAEKTAEGAIVTRERKLEDQLVFLLQPSWSSWSHSLRTGSSLYTLTNRWSRRKLLPK